MTRLSDGPFSEEALSWKKWFHTTEEKKEPIYVTRAAGESMYTCLWMFWGSWIDDFSPKWIFIYFLLHDWVNTFRLQTGLRWGNIFSGTDKEVYDRKYVSVCMRGHFISEKTNNIFICSLVLFPNCPTRPPCQELMVGCVWRARTVCLNVKTIRSRRLQGPGQQENSGIRTRTVCRFVFENTTGSNTFPNELHY